MMVGRRQDIVLRNRSIFEYIVDLYACLVLVLLKVYVLTEG